MSSVSASNASSVTVRQLFAPLLAVIVGMFMVILDSTVVNVALPHLREIFKTDYTTMQWTVTGYTLALSAVIPLAGWMTDRFGAKRIFLITITLFTLGSVLCSFASSPGQLILFRVIQGLGGGMVAPIGMAMIFKLAPPEKMGSIMGMLGIPMLLAPALGPVLSGYFVEYVSWHWIFLINLPVGIIALIIGIKFLPKFEKKAVPSLDILGIILAPIAFAMLAYGVSEGGRDWSSTEALLGLLVGGIALIIFIFVELLQKQPLLELRVFKSSDFTRGVIIAWVSQIALFGAIILMPLYLQGVRGYTPLQSGLSVLPQALASGIFMPIGGRLFDRFGARPLVIIGLSIITIALTMLTNISLSTSSIYILGALAMLGSGMGLSMMAINTHVLQSAPRKLVSRVTPLTTAAQQVMVSFAVAGLTGYLTSRLTAHMAHTTNPLLAQVDAFGDTFLVTACVAAFGALLGIILRKPKKEVEDDASVGTESTDASANSAALLNH
ncbi:EmrB/QacA subfamily drug resistance transporter [Paenibacillus shirakamiensis]|uniref:EmrB/QacA subfamily drug resistance transporter n=1 Tax=Paenibacillus shirakamiensis TaxID=1265935 RepID=A0ABS4JF83_9BACL|nr:DHA2 family efflux MFS transporter permease subunit [Paenibacillus shirakamiensis]MBP2000373.1 EmrB/QacA subfamily drug resistance transporter [Paenibacillus shirakamiensis]